MSGVVVSRDGAVLTVRLDRPATYNALTGDLVRDLLAALRGVVGQDEVRVVLLTGTGPAFSGGADLSGPDPAASYDADSVEAANLMIRAVLDLDQPVVCGLNGVAAGVGMSLALACDLVVATGSASLTLGFSRIGLMPDGGATATVAASVGRATAMRLALLSEVVGAREALAAGLVSHVFADEEYADGLAAILARLAAGPPLALAATKKAVNAAALAGLEPAFAREHRAQPVLLRSADASEGMRAFAEKRRPEFRGR